MKFKKIKLANLEPGPIQHTALPADLVARIHAYRNILGDADPGSIDNTIDGFRRDLNPDKEVAIWERIAHIFQNFTTGHAITDLAHRREVLRALLMISTGGDVKATATLTSNDIAELKYNF